jgi:molybdenum cofactor biosynthesis enzyme MoaA
LQSALQALHDIVARQIPLKINSVVLADTNDEEIIGLAGLAQKLPITLRFICVLGITFGLFSLQGAGGI